MIPILYQTVTEGTVPSDYGLGVLTDCLKCEVTEERNGSYELVLEYASAGIHAEEIEVNRFVKAKPNFTDSPQLFRIYKVGKEMNGHFTVYGQHISYDLSGKIATSGSADSCANACILLTSNFAGDFTITTDKVVSAHFEIDVPSSVRSWFGGKAGSFLDVFGTGEWYYDNYSARFLAHRGQDRSVQLRYGKNLTELSQEIDMTNLTTGVIPYAVNPDTGISAVGSKINTGITLDVTRDIAVDFTEDIDWEQEVMSQLATLGAAYVSRYSSDLTNLTDSITLNFVQLSDLTDRVDLCDTVHIYFEALGISASAKCVATTWDVLKERYTSCTFGSPKQSIATTLADQQRTLSDIESDVAVLPTTSNVKNIVNTATMLITGNSGGYVVIHDSNGDGKPDEILVMDAATIGAATKVWRWNQNGLGYSSTGYAGPYGTAMTANGEIVADFIKAGVISDALGNSTIDMTNGIAKMYELSAIKGFNILTEGDEDVKSTMSATQYSSDIILSAKDAENYPQTTISTYSRSGTEYAELKMSADGTNENISIEAQSLGGKIYAKNASGVRVAELFARNDQQGGTVQVKDGSGNPAGYLTVDANGSGEVTLLESGGDTRVHFFDNTYGGCVDLVSNAGTAVGLWTDSTYCGHVHVENNAYEHTVELDGSKGEVQCLRILPYDPSYSVDNASGTMHLDASGWEVRRMGNVVYMAIPFKGTGVNVPAGSTAFTGTLTDGDLPAIPTNMVAYYSGDVFILNIKPTGEMTLRNCGAARIFTSNQGITICGSFVVD